MKKTLIGAAILAGATLASCTGNLVSQSTSTPNQTADSTQTTSPAIDEQNTYIAQTIMSMNLLDASPVASLAARKARAVDPTVYDALAEDILSGIEGITAITNFNPGEVVEKTSDKAEYAKLFTITMNGLDGTSETYDLYFNEETRTYQEGKDETETVTTLRGLAIKDGVEFTLSGTETEETEGRETERELELKISRDRSNYVLIEQEFEFNENEYEYTLVENGREVSSSEYSLETDRRGNVVVSLEREESGKEFEIKVLQSEAGIEDVLVEIEHPSLGEINGRVTISQDAEGSTVYTLTFFGYDKTYVKTVA